MYSEFRKREVDPECLEASGTHLESVPPPDWVVSEQKRLDCEMNVLLVASAAAPRLSGNSGEGGLIT